MRGSVLTGRILLFAYGLLAIGGPGLHHAPLFGLHSCCETHQVGNGHFESESYSACGCGQVHVAHESPLAQVSQNGHQHDSAQPHDCVLCKFYSTPYCEFEQDSHPVVDRIQMETPSFVFGVPTIEPGTVWARGPPAINI